MGDLPEIESDGEVIEAVLAGDSDRFGVLVRRYRRALLKLAENRLGRPELAEDAVQETLLCAFRSLRSYDSRYSFRTWLWTIALNQCKRHYAKSQRREQALGGQPLPEADAALVESATPADDAAARERAELLRRLLEELPEPQADALRLRFFGGLKFHEIAEAQDCSLSSAKTRVRLGLLKMSQRMQPSEIGGELP